MYGSLLFAFLTALFAAHISAGQASPVRELQGDLPPAFLHVFDRDDAEDFYSQAAVDALTEQSGLQRSGLPADLFEKAASRGLATLERKRPAPSLEEWIAIASVGGLYSASAGASDVDLASSASDGPGITVRQLAQILVNRVEQPASGRPAARERGIHATGGFSLVSAIMQSRLDTAFVEAAAEVVSPTVTADGMIAVDFLGLRDFAFLVSPVTNRIQIMDFKTGLTVTLNQRGYGEAAAAIQFGVPDFQPPEEARTPVPQMTIQDLLLRVERFLSTYLLHPFTLGSLLLCGIFWLVLRIGRRSA